MLTLQQATEYLQTNKDLLNLTAIAKRLSIDPATLYRGVTGRKHSNGRDTCKIPKKALHDLQIVVDQLTRPVTI